MSKRTEKVDSLLKRYISEIIQNDLSDPRIQGIISVSSVNVAPDLSYAKVFLSIFNNSKDETLLAIKSASGYIKKRLSSMVDFRIVPTLDFQVDNSAEYSEKINKIINSLNMENKD